MFTEWFGIFQLVAADTKYVCINERTFEPEGVYPRITSMRLSCRQTGFMSQNQKLITSMRVYQTTSLT